jgi:signal transduction histidine kinase
MGRFLVRHLAADTIGRGRLDGIGAGPRPAIGASPTSDGSAVRVVPVAVARPRCDDSLMNARLDTDRGRTDRGRAVSIGVLLLGLATSSIPLYVPGWWFDVTSHGQAADLPTRLALGGSGFISVVAGVVVRTRRPENPIGNLLTLSGLLGPLAFMVGSGSALLTIASGVAFVLATAIGVAVVITFPTGRLGGRSPLAIAATSLAVLLFRIQQVATADPVASIPGWREPNPFHVELSGPVAQIAIDLYFIAGIGFLLAFGTWLGRRWRGLRGPSRRSIAPVLLGGLVFVVASVVQAVVEITTADAQVVETVRFVHTLSFSAISVGFMAGLLRIRMARSAVADLVVELGDTPEPARLRQALATALDDPSLEVLLWAADAGAYLDESGAKVGDVDEHAGDRAVTALERAGEPLAAIVHDAALLDDPGLVASVATAVRLAVENDRLRREVETQLAEVRASRARIVEAADAERRRLERDIHDGAQQRLVALSMALGRARAEVEAGAAPDSAVLAETLGNASDEVRTALAELRELARGIHPAILTQAGLDAAVGSLVERAAVPARLEGSIGRRVSPPVEATAYFVVSEGLANAAKHASPSEVIVRLALADGELAVGVSDDGCGGASVDAGNGLRGLRDRVEAIGGRLELSSPPDAGTLLRAHMPLGDAEP